MIAADARNLMVESRGYVDREMNRLYKEITKAAKDGKDHYDACVICENPKVKIEIRDRLVKDGYRLDGFSERVKAPSFRINWGHLVIFEDKI